MIKSAIKSVLPTPATEWVADKVRFARFVSSPKLAFDATNLRRLDSIPDLFSECRHWVSDGVAEIGDGVNPGDRRALYYLVSALKPKRVLEIGTNIGASTYHIAKAMNRYGGQLTTVDIIDAKVAKESTSGLGVRFVLSKAQDFMKTEERFDLVFLDGDHGEGAVYAEVCLSLRIINPNGLILLHDYYPRGMKAHGSHVINGPYRAMKRIMRENTVIKVKPLWNLPWETKQGSTMTTLAIVARG